MSLLLNFEQISSVVLQEDKLRKLFYLLFSSNSHIREGLFLRFIPFPIHGMFYFVFSYKLILSTRFNF